MNSNLTHVIMNSVVIPNLQWINISIILQLQMWQGSNAGCVMSTLVMTNWLLNKHYLHKPVNQYSTHACIYILLNFLHEICGRSFLCLSFQKLQKIRTIRITTNYYFISYIWHVSSQDLKIRTNPNIPYKVWT